MFKLNAIMARKKTKIKVKRINVKNQKKATTTLKKVKKKIWKGILTAINNGEYECVITYHYDFVNPSPKEKEYAFSILYNEEYLKEYYQDLGYIIKIKDTGISARIEIYWMEE